MKYTLLSVSVIFIILFGCMKSQIEDSLIERNNDNQYTVATVVSTGGGHKKFAECVQNGLEKQFHHLKFISEEKFRDTFYPWFEPDIAPDEADELLAILNKAMVRNRIEALGLELLIYVHGLTIQGEFDGSGGGHGGVAVGYMAAERETYIGTSLWDLKEAELLGDTDVTVKGKMHMPIVGIPILIPALSESSACSETVKRISTCLKGKNLNKEK